MSTFCPKCEDYCETQTTERDETYKLRGKSITIPVMLQVCTTCGEELGSDEQDQEMLQAVHTEYRRQNGLLTPEQIRAIRKGYNLSQKAFAVLLGMGDVTITRYEGGALQDQVHDNAIRACEALGYVRDILTRRGHLLTSLQRRRLQKALGDELSADSGWADLIPLSDAGPTPNEVSILTGNRRFDLDRFTGAVLWYCQERQDPSRTVINKFLFYADFLNYKSTTVSLTGSAYRRAQFGPVPTHYGDILEALVSQNVLVCVEKSYRGGETGYHYSPGPNAGSVSIEFSDHEQRVLNQVADALQGCTAKNISERSHQEAAWIKTEDRQLISYELAEELSLNISDD